MFLSQFQGSFQPIFPQEDGAAVMELNFPLLRGQKIGSRTWRVEFNNEIKNQMDQALDCPLGIQRFDVVRRRI